MIIPVYRKVKTEVEIDVRLIAENLINSNLGCIIDSLMDEFYEDPLTYMPEEIETDEDIKEAVYNPLRNELEKILTEC